MAKKQLQEMDVAAGTKQSKTAVNANAKPAMPMDTSVAGSVEAVSYTHLTLPTNREV